MVHVFNVVFPLWCFCWNDKCSCDKLGPSKTPKGKSESGCIINHYKKIIEFIDLMWNYNGINEGMFIQS